MQWLVGVFVQQPDDEICIVKVFSLIDGCEYS